MRLHWLLFVVFSLVGCESNNKSYVEITTDFGTMKFMLYDSTPQHRDNFIKLTKEGFYDSLLFHRVIDGFMIQGGDPASKNAPKGEVLGKGGPGYTIPAEISAPHFKGTLAAARQPDNINPMRVSSGSQFFIVHGKSFDELQLGYIELEKGISYNEAQKELYREVGGYPLLDNEYTVFGEMVEGMEVLEKIVKVQTDRYKRPLEDVRMQIKIIE